MTDNNFPMVEEYGTPLLETTDGNGPTVVCSCCCAGTGC